MEKPCGPVLWFGPLSIFLRSARNFRSSFADLFLKFRAYSKTILLLAYPGWVFIFTFRESWFSLGFFPIIGCGLKEIRGGSPPFLRSCRSCIFMVLLICLILFDQSSLSIFKKLNKNINLSMNRMICRSRYYNDYDIVRRYLLSFVSKQLAWERLPCIWAPGQDFHFALIIWYVAQIIPTF